VWYNANNDMNTENNILKIKCNYKNGKLNGLYQEWHNNGKLWNKCTYLNGEYDGDFESWERNGFLIDARFYINGKLQTNKIIPIYFLIVYSEVILIYYIMN
jgi:hypothetical protein